MTDGPLVGRGGPTEPLILVVDDDRRVRELLEIAFGSQGYRVIVAADGDEAVRRASADQPDLIVLDVRLPRRSGLEVCDRLRREPESALVPIIIVSAAAEGEVRLQAFQRGADDFMLKPFSPRELLARVRRLLARSQELRVARSRLADIERELSRSRRETGQARDAVESSRRRNDFARRLGAALSSNDPDLLADAILHEARMECGAAAAALFVRDSLEDEFEPWRIQGDTFDRIATIRFSATGELARFLSALGRPAEVRSLAHARELEPELGPLAAARFQLLAPIGSATGIQAVLAVESLPAGPSVPSALEAIGVLCSAAASPMATAHDARRRAALLLELAGFPTGDDYEAGATRRAAAVVWAAARAAGVPPRTATLARLGVLAGRGAIEADGWWAIERAGRCDGTLLIPDLRVLLRAASAMVEAELPIESLADAAGEADRQAWQPDVAAAVVWVVAGWRISAHLHAGASIAEAVRGEPGDRPEFHRAFEQVAATPEFADVER